MVSRGVEPLLCHVIGIAGKVVLKDILCAGMHPRDICHDGIKPGIEIIMAERTG